MIKKLAKAKFTQVVTKVGTLNWAHILKEEEWKGTPTGKFSCQIKFDSEEETQAFLKELEAEYLRLKEETDLFKDIKPKRGSCPGFGEKEDQNGEISFKATTKSTYKNKAGEEFKKVVPVFDAKGKPITGVNIGNGSRGKLCLSLAPKTKDNSCYGLNLWLDAIQIIDLKEYGSDSQNEDASKFGFGQEEGYTAPEKDESAEEANPFTTADAKGEPEEATDGDF